ncbi:hypothetical protein [Pseudomonas phage Hadban]|nr:hypothetical protein [Pseudomonas phage Hadban]
MIRRLINRIQGKVWSAGCSRCQWNGGRTDLTEDQAYARANGHARNAHGIAHGMVTYRKGKKQVAVIQLLPFR